MNIVVETHVGGVARFLDKYRFRIVAGEVVSCPAEERPQPPASPPAAGAMVVMSASVMAAGVLQAPVQNKASLNKNKNKNKNQHKNKNKNKAFAADLAAGGGALMPSFEFRRLHQQPSPSTFVAARKFTWEQLDIPLPPGPDVTRLETEVMLSLQGRDRERARRRDDIKRESSFDVSDFLRVLGVDELSGYENTEGLFLSILTACEYVGLIYKAAFNRTRPSLMEPRLRPLLSNPPHQAYPSNHSFQCHSIAFAFNTILPEHPGTEELLILARKVAENREWAGLHYPSDTNGGRALAQRFQPYLRDAFATRYLAAQREWI